MWHRPVCVACSLDMYPEKIGVPFVEQFMDGNEMQPYKIWAADRWSCPKCKISVLIDFGKDAHAFHYEPTFPGILEIVKGNEWVVIEQENPKIRKERGMIPHTEEKGADYWMKQATLLNAEPPVKYLGEQFGCALFQQNAPGVGSFIIHPGETFDEAYERAQKRYMKERTK